MNKEELLSEMSKNSILIEEVSSEIRSILNTKLQDDLELQLMVIDYLKGNLEIGIQIRDYSYMQLEEE